MADARREPSTASRPAGVPEDAEWDARARQWSVGSKDAEGRWDGAVTSYAEQGTRCSVQHFRAGTAHGPWMRYHPNGELARRGEFVDGQLHGEMRAFGSHQPTQERLRACCVPETAWCLVARYDQGRCLAEWFENEAGETLLLDGSVAPTKPPELPESARFDEFAGRWFQGRHDAKRLREGTWLWWSVPGVLLEETRYRAGKRWGAARFYSETGALLSERTFEADELSGPAVEHRVVPDFFADERVARWQGGFVNGSFSGSWHFYDSAGAELYHRDFGTPLRDLEAGHPVLASATNAEGWRALAHGLREARQPALCLLALAREAAVRQDPRRLREALQDLTVPLSGAESGRRVEELRALRKPSVNGRHRTLTEEQAAWTQALLSGVAPAVVLTSLGLLLASRPAAGLDFVEAALLLDPESPTAWMTRALLRIEHGEPDLAEQDLPRIEAVRAASAQMLRDRLNLFFPKFGFWPEVASLELPSNSELPSEVSQPLEQVQLAIAKSALRLRQIRAALEREHPTPAAWLPPDFRLEGANELELLRYSFIEKDPVTNEPDEVVVNETLALEGLGITSLMRLARVEWTCLTWLCWGAGSSRVEYPRTLTPPSDYASALATAFFRVFRIADSLQTRGLRARSRGAPRAHWEGRDVDTLEPVFMQMARDEALETRAVLFWLGDDECRSLWQDDLREA